MSNLRSWLERDIIFMVATATGNRVHTVLCTAGVVDLHSTEDGGDAYGGKTWIRFSRPYGFWNVPLSVTDIYLLNLSLT